MRPVDGFVLAGGRSRRMGTDKARVAWGHLPLAVAAARALRSRCDRVAIVRRRSDDLPWIDGDDQPIEVLFEEASGEEHPLWGVEAALRAARTEIALLSPCDTPSLTANSLIRLADAAPAVAVCRGQLHPLVAALPVGLADEARRLAASGAPAHRLVRDLPAVEIPEEELRDHNDPASLGAGPVAELLARIPPVSAEQRERIARGERARLRARGIVHPEAVL